MLDRIETGIAGFDKMLWGGFLKGDAVMVVGSSGMGKTTFGLEYLVNGATKFGQNGLYVTFEQLPEQIYRDAKSFGWDLRRLEASRKLKVICTSPDIILSSSGAREVFEEAIGEVHPCRIVIDSLSHLSMYIDEKVLRKETYRLICYLRAEGLSSLLTYEAPPSINGMDAARETDAAFLVDCVILLKPVEIESSMRKAMVVLKMRGSDHDAGLREFKISNKGIVVMDRFKNYENIMSGSARRSVTEDVVNSWSSMMVKRAELNPQRGSR